MTTERIHEIIMDQSKSNFTLLSGIDQWAIKKAMKLVTNEVIDEYHKELVKHFLKSNDTASYEKLTKIAERLKVK